MLTKIVFSCITIFCARIWMTRTLLTPIQIMQAGISSIRTDYNLTHLDIKVSDFNTFISGPHCVSGIHSKEEFDSIVRPQLNAPSGIAHDIISNKIVFEKIDITASVSDTKHSSTYRAQWAITYDDMTDTYNICIAIAGLSFTRPDIITGYTETTQQVVIGKSITNCGIIRCDHVPVISNTTTRIPIYESTYLSLNEQILLSNTIKSQLTQAIRDSPTETIPMISAKRFVHSITSY